VAVVARQEIRFLGEGATNVHGYRAAGGLLGLVGLIGLLGSIGIGAAFARPTIEPCDGPGVDPWIGELRDRVTSYDGLARFALEHYGAPVACEGAVTSEFDGAKFGTLLLSFPEGVTLEVETMPPETSIVTLQSPSGFHDEGVILAALRARTAEIGLAIDWEAPEESMEGNRSVRRFWDPDPGLNASASLVYSAGVLVAVGVSMAL